MHLQNPHCGVCQRSTAKPGVVVPAQQRPVRTRRHRVHAANEPYANGVNPSENGYQPASNGQLPNLSKPAADPSGENWALLGFPTYLQNSSPRPFPCEEPQDKDGDGRWKRENIIWNSIRRQAQVDAAAEPLLSSFMYASVLAHDSFEKALAFVLANRLANTTLLPTQLFEIFVEILQNDADVRCGALADVEAAHERDPACQTLLQPLLYNKGYHALQSYRIAHALWVRGQRVMALALQSRVSEVFAVDIHPAAKIGKGILLDHGTGVVIGETVVVGDNCSILQNVTLGGTGKEMGDRHPKLADNVLIGANATVLGNISIGQGAQIAAGSLVLKPVDPCTMVAGSPAKEVGKVQGNSAQTMSHVWQPDVANPYTAMSSPIPAQQQQQQKPAAGAASGVPSAASLLAPRQTPPSAARKGEGSSTATVIKTAPAKPTPAVSGAPPAPPKGREGLPLQHWPLAGRAPSNDPVLPGEGI